jgi:hypothetical protein
MEKFGETPETKKLIEEPNVQGRLLKGDIPYQCNDCKVIFLIDQQVVHYFRREFYNYYSATRNFKPPRGLTCIKSRYVIDRSKCPPQVTSNPSLGSAYTSGFVFPYSTEKGNINVKRPPNP